MAAKTSGGGWVFDRTGSHVAIDFANTVSGRASGQPIERLAAYEDFVEFARQTRLAGDAEAGSMLARARRSPEEGRRVHEKTLALRDALHAIFAAVARGEHPEERDLATLNEQVSRLRITESFRWRFDTGPGGLDAPLCAVVRGALELLEPSLRERIGACGREACGLLFLDLTKNRTRRWCDMKTCGNREKARRFREGGRD